MAGTITSAGLGSGIDVESLITQLMSLEKQPITKLQAKDKSYDTKLSAFGTLKSQLSSLQTAAESISTKSTYAVYKATIADTAVASAVAGSSAKAGSYQLEVNSLATSQVAMSASKPNGYTFATGTLTIATGSKTTNISITAGNNSMTGMRDAINAANAGVTASLVTDVSGDTSLKIASTNTGTSNAFTLTGIGLDFDPSNIPGSGAEIYAADSYAATNAQFKINGTSYVRQSNYVTNAIGGVSLSLSATNTGHPTTLSISQSSTKSSFSSYKTSVADSTIASAAAGSGATAGSYQLEVSSLASTQKIVTAPLASGYTFATGPLTLTAGGTTTNINITTSNNTLSGMRDAINAANAGVSASLLNDGSGTRLILSAAQSGTDYGVTVSGLGLSFDPNNISASGTLVDQLTSKAATNAVFKLDGIEITRSSNTITDALDDVSLTLTKTNISNPTSFSVSQDKTAMEDKVKAFITAYNSVISNIKSQTAYNAETKTASALNGDAAVRSIQSQLRNVVGGTLASGSLTRLSDVGIKIEKDGSLTLDSTKFQSVLSDPTKDVGALFTSSGSVSGFADQVTAKVKAFLDTDGLLTSRTDGIKKSQLGIDKQIETLETRLEAIEARYRKQFTALDSTVSSWNSTGNYLTQQLSSLLTKYN